MSPFKIDINADLGEGIGNDELLMPLLSSCNIACGGHAGNETSMRMVVELAKKHKVKIGAHPSFPDKDNFGRRVMDIDHGQLFDSVLSQTIDLYNITEQEGVTLNHIKPHGALYNLAAVDTLTAKLVINVILSFSDNIKLYAPYNSVIAKLAKSENIQVVYEAFADRNYNENLSLVSRQNSKALITNKIDVLNHVFNIISKKKVNTISGVEVELLADTICVHGDTKNAVEILKYLNEELPKNGVEIE